MTQMMRRGALMMTFAFPLVAGCASDGCEYLAYEETVPRERPPLVIPEGVRAPAESGEFNIPAGETREPGGRCMAVPPMILPEEVLESATG